MIFRESLKNVFRIQMSEKITVEYQNVREKAREMSDNAKELWDKWEKHKRGYFHFNI